MKHLETIHLEHPAIMKMMDNIKSLETRRKDVREEIRLKSYHLNRLEAISIGKTSELFEALQVIYGIKEPKDGFQLQFNFKTHCVRLIENGHNSMLHHPYGMPGEDWQKEIDESEIDWDNPKQVEEYNEYKAKEWKKIRSLQDDGIDWSNDGTDDKDKDDDDDRDGPPTQKV